MTLRPIAMLTSMLMLMFGTSLPAFSFEKVEVKSEVKTEKVDDSEHGAHKKEPPTETMGIKRYDLGIYTLIVFVLLLVILGKFAWKPMMEGLDKREALIRSAKEESEKALAETAKLRAELEAQKVKGAEEVKAMIDEARRDAETLREKFKVDATAEIAAERDRLRKEIESAKDQALSEIWGKAVSLATLISTKTVKKQLTEDDHRKLIDESLTELKTSFSKAG